MKICMISLGCDKNLVDSEMMLGYLKRDDVSLTDEQAEADVIIVNTCAFILDAKDESIQTMLTAARYKEEGQLKALIMAGCMAERYKDEFLKSMRLSALPLTIKSVLCWSASWRVRKSRNSKI